MAGKNLVELAEDEPAGPAPPAESADRRMDDPGVLGDRQIRAKRQLLVNRAQAERFGARRRIRALFAGDHEPAAIRNDAAVQDVHQGRFARAIVSDDPDAFAGAKENRRRPGLGRRRRIFRYRRNRPERPRPPSDYLTGAPVRPLHIRLDRGNGVGLRVFVAGDAALRNVGQFLLKSSWVKAR